MHLCVCVCVSLSVDVMSEWIDKRYARLQIHTQPRHTINIYIYPLLRKYSRAAAVVRGRERLLTMFMDWLDGNGEGGGGGLPKSWSTAARIATAHVVTSPWESTVCSGFRLTDWLTAKGTSKLFFRWSSRPFSLFAFFCVCVLSLFYTG